MPPWLLRLRIVEFTLDHEAPYFSNMRRRNSRKDSDLTGVVDLRYTGGARLLLMLELGELQAVLRGGVRGCCAGSVLCVHTGTWDGMEPGPVARWAEVIAAWLMCMLLRHDG
jgi:hypothetical protein